MSVARFDAYARELLDAYNSKEIEEVVTPYGKKATAYRVSGISHFTELMTKFMIAEGMIKREDFQHMDQTDVEIIGSLANLKSIFRAEKDRIYRLKMERTARQELKSKARFAASPSLSPMDPQLKAKLLAELKAESSTSGNEPDPPEIIGKE